VADLDAGLSARLCALTLLDGVLSHAKILEEAFQKQVIKYDLDRQNRAFVMALSRMVLRYKPALQDIINKAGNRKNPFTPDLLNTLLLMGAAQILLMATPDHAAVDTSVNLAKKIKCSKQKNMVNAILRRVSRERDKYGCLHPSLPSWLTATWIKDYGADIAAKIEQASLQEAPLDITVNGHTEIDGDLSLRGGHIRLLRYHGAVADLPEYEAGTWWVQDFASSMPVSLLDDLTGKHVLDLCAAPGGKTMQLVARGAKVTSVDIAEKRLRRLEENLQRTCLREHVEIVCADILKYKPDRQFDIVLLDTPCSATGTIRRHPDLSYVRSKRQITDLAILQSRLLVHIADWIKQDGLLVYCTCSLQQDEGEHQIARFLQENRHYTRVIYDMYKEWHSRDGDIRLLPFYHGHNGGMDGFFISVLKKNKL